MMSRACADHGLLALRNCARPKVIAYATEYCVCNHREACKMYKLVCIMSEFMDLLNAIETFRKKRKTGTT